MDVKEAIDKRRAYRALEKTDIDKSLINELVRSAQLAPSCFNNQPWRFVFAHGREVLEKLYTAMSRGNEWVFNSSMVIAVFSEPEKDCRIKGREYFLFDTGIAVGFILLRATELGMVAHPIAGFNESEVKKILQIPDNMTLITLVIVGRHSKSPVDHMSDRQKEDEKNRPERLPLNEIYCIDSYREKG